MVLCSLFDVDDDQRLLQLVDVCLYLDSRLGIGRLGQSAQPLWPSSIFTRSATLFAVRATAQQAVLDSTSGTPVQSSTWWKLDDEDGSALYDSDDEEMHQFEQQRALLASQISPDAGKGSGAPGAGGDGAEGGNAEFGDVGGVDMASEHHVDDLPDEADFYDERGWRAPRPVGDVDEDEDGDESKVNDAALPESLENEPNHVYVAERLCKTTAHVRGGAPRPNSKANLRSVYFAPFYDRVADTVATDNMSRHLQIMAAQAAADEAVAAAAADPEDEALAAAGKAAADALATAKQSPSLRTVSEISGCVHFFNLHSQS